MLTASRRKFRIFVPNFNRASSAASSAFSMSFNRFEASIRNLARTPSDSLSAASSSDIVFSASSFSSVVFPVAAESWTADIALVRLRIEERRSPRPREASVPTWVSSLDASLYTDSPYQTVSPCECGPTRPCGFYLLHNIAKEAPEPGTPGTR